MRVVFLLLFFVSLMVASELKHTTSKEESFVVSFSLAKAGEFSFKKYEVFAPETKVPFAKGETDALSRVVFLPNKKGVWRVEVFSTNGHKTVVNIDVNEQLQGNTKNNDEDFSFIEELIGLLILLSIFGVLYVRKDKQNPDIR